MNSNVGGLIILAAFFTSFFSSVVPKAFWTKEYFPRFQFMFQIVAIGILIISWLCRYIYSNNCQKQMLNNEIQLNKYNKISFLKKNKIKDFFKIIGFTLLLTSIALWMFYRSVQDTNIILILFSTACLNWYIYRNLTFRKPDIIDYKMTKKEYE